MPKHLRAFAPVLLAALTVAAVGAVTAGAATPAGGAIHVLGTSNGLGTGGVIEVTGAIGDHGTTRTVNKAGKTDGNGAYVLLKLSQGTILLNKSKLDQAINHAFGKASANQATCSIEVSGTGPVTFISGTGLYKGITGTARITVAIGFTFPRTASGKCNESNSATPTSSLQLVSGDGSVHFG